MVFRSWIVGILTASVNAGDFICDSANFHLCEDVPVNIRLHNGVEVDHTPDYIMSANDDGKGLRLVPIVNSPLQKFTFERTVDGRHYIRVLKKTQQGDLISTSNGYLDVHLFNRDDGNQRWDLWWRGSGNDQWVEFHRDVNPVAQNRNLELEGNHSNLELQGGHRRRRIKDKNFMVTDGGGRILLGYEMPEKSGGKPGYEKWDISTGDGCYVIDPSKVVGKWYDLQQTITCKGCWKFEYTGYVLNGDATIDAKFSAKIKMVMKAGISLGGFGITSNVKVSLGLTLAAHLELDFTKSKESGYAIFIPVQDADLYFGKKVWQFVVEATDTCNQKVTTRTSQLVYTDIGKAPCCMPGFGIGANYSTCVRGDNGEDTRMPGAKNISYCQLKSAEELVV